MKLKITIALFFIAGIAFGQNNTLTFTIKGKIDDLKEPASVVLEYWSVNGKKQRDSVALLHGNFLLKGAIGKPGQAMLYVLKKSDPNPTIIKNGGTGELGGVDGITLYLDKGNITITGKTLKEAVVKGSAAHSDYLVLQKSLISLCKRFEVPEGTKVDKETVKKFGEELNLVQETFVREHPNSYVSWNLVARGSVTANPEKQKKLLESFGPKFLNTEEGKRALNSVEMEFKTAIGQPAKLFSLDDVNGNPIALSSFKGKYVLLDFWASWCGPCRAEFPHVLKAYKKFKDKNFEVLGVSVDENKEKWLKAIEEDGLPWVNVRDVKGTKDDAARLYNVTSVPTNYLIDPNGKIIAKNLRGEEVAEKLAEVLGN